MRKKTIAILFIIGFVLAVLGGILSSVGAASAASTAAYGTAPQLGVTYFVGIGLSVIGGVISLIAWIGALIATARLSRWGWFVVVLLLGGLGELIYLIGGPSVQS